MTETLISPGVFLQETDLTPVTQGPIEVGAALVGPTVIGEVNIPTVVTSYSQYKQLFGAGFISGSTAYEFLTSIAALNYFEQGGTSLLVTRVASGSYTSATASIAATGSGAAFILETISDGEVMNNNEFATASLGLLPSGSSVNVRWEIAQVDQNTGKFTLLVRRGDDYQNSKTALETWSGLSLDPNEPSFISYVLGDTVFNPVAESTGDYYLGMTGSYANKSRYVRVKEVVASTPGYVGVNGLAKSEYTASLPQIGSGSVHGAFGGASGKLFGGQGVERLNMFENIPSSTASRANNVQGVIGNDYAIALNLLNNKDAYKFNVIFVPGLNSQNSKDTITSVITLAQDRGDCIAVVDMTGFNRSVAEVVAETSNYDSSYAATYWPWIQVKSRETGRSSFVPTSTVVPAVYEYNDRISAEWFAPAGLNRGGLPNAIQPERRITATQKNTLYQSRVNPIGVFPGIGTVIYGQKTLQAKSSALDRVNVRRLLISLKDYIGKIAEQLVFEPNNQITRNKFLTQVNPYLEYVQQRQGLYAFQVIMDESNNTPDVIDRNELVGTIYLQPTRTAEFIKLDFNILPTGATFGQ
jgi:hypothetical protein